MTCNKFIAMNTCCIKLDQIINPGLWSGCSATDWRWSDVFFYFLLSFLATSERRERSHRTHAALQLCHLRPTHRSLRRRNLFFVSARTTAQQEQECKKQWHGAQRFPHMNLTAFFLRIISLNKIIIKSRVSDSLVCGSWSSKDIRFWCYLIVCLNPLTAVMI